MNIDKIAEAICGAGGYIWGLLTPEEREPYLRRAERAVEVFCHEHGDVPREKEDCQ